MPLGRPSEHTPEIGNFIGDIEWCAKNIGRKSVENHAADGDFHFSLIVNKETQQ